MGFAFMRGVVALMLGGSMAFAATPLIPITPAIHHWLADYLGWK